MEYLFAHHFF